MGSRVLICCWVSGVGEVEEFVEFALYACEYLLLSALQPVHSVWTFPSMGFASSRIAGGSGVRRFREATVLIRTIM